MTKKLLVQIKNEWRNNLWLALELLVVSVVMWFVVDYLYTRMATYLEPRGFDISHCYLIEMGKLTDKSPDYIPNQTDEQEDADILELVDRLRRRPEIEAVSLSQNSYPYNGSNSTDLVQYDTLVSGNWTIRRLVTPDFVRVFRYQGTRGETPEQLAGMLEKGRVPCFRQPLPEVRPSADGVRRQELPAFRRHNTNLPVGSGLEGCTLQ